MWQETQGGRQGIRQLVTLFAVRKHRDECRLSLLFLFYSVWVPAQRMVLLTFRMNL